MSTDNISVFNKTTGMTFMHSVFQRFTNFCTTDTGLACAARVDRLNNATSFFSFVAHECGQLAPSGIVNGLREKASGKSFDVQVFNSDMCGIM